MSSDFRTWLRAAALGFGALLALLLPGTVGAADFTPDQRKAIEAIVHDYLTKNPDVLLDALQAAEDKIKGDARDKAAQALSTRRHEIFDDPETPFAGNPKGDVSLVEFFDYRCPYCKQVEPAIDALLREDGRIRLVYKEFPVLGPDSVYASRAALASRKQGKYGKFHDAMMAQKGTLDASVVMQLAAAAGLDVDKLKADMGSPDIEAVIKRNYALAQALEIHGTPAFVIGDEMVPGAIDIAALRQKIATARKS
jgi:protein-disulfide isomerase